LSASRVGRFTTGEANPGTPWIGACVGLYMYEISVKWKPV